MLLTKLIDDIELLPLFYNIIYLTFQHILEYVYEL